MQSSVIRSRTSISKSLPASFKLSTFISSSESYIEIFCFINKDAQDLERHIYKLGIQEQLKESYNFRAVRRGNKLYLFVDGRELGRLDIHYPASCVGFCSGNYSPVYKGILYYHIGN